MWQKRATLPKLVPDPRDLEQSGEFPSATESAGPASCATPRWPAERAHVQCSALAERERVRLIADISKMLHDPCVPEPAKAAGLTFRTVEEAIEKANNTAYGLSAGVWTDKGSRILKMSTELKAGVVWANTYNKFDPTSPFGGYKESGFGREGGRHGLEAYLDV